MSIPRLDRCGSPLQVDTSRLEVAQEFVQLARAVRSEGDLYRLMEDVTFELGFRHFALIHHVDLKQNSSTTIRLHNYPESWAQKFIDDGLYAYDPVLRASLMTNVGFAWADVPSMIELTHKQRNILETAAKEGLADGYTVPAHIPGEYAGSCSFAAQRGHRTSRKTQLLAEIIGAFAFQAARRLKQVSPLDCARSHCLTPRQRECLLWAIRGKTDWEIGRILGLSEDTVTQHPDMARNRYGMGRRLQLAVRAIYDGEVSFIEALSGQFPPNRE